MERAVGIATGYWLDDRGVGVPSPGGVKNFHFSISSRPTFEVQLTFYPMGNVGSLPWGKAAGA
jgi:hypothetical protein